MNENQIRKKIIENKSFTLKTYTHDELIPLLSTKGPIANLWLTPSSIIIVEGRKIIQYSLADIVWLGYSIESTKYHSMARLHLIDCYGKEERLCTLEVYQADALIEFLSHQLDFILFDKKHKPIVLKETDRSNIVAQIKLDVEEDLQKLVLKYTKQATRDSLQIAIVFAVFFFTLLIAYGIYELLVPLVQTHILESDYSVQNFLYLQILPEIATVLLGVLPLLAMIIAFPLCYRKAGYAKQMLTKLSIVFLGLSGMITYFIVFEEDTLETISSLISATNSELVIHQEVRVLQGFGNGDGLNIETLGDFEYAYKGVDQFYVSSAALTSLEVYEYDYMYYLGTFPSDLFSNVTPLMYEDQEVSPTKFNVTYTQSTYDYQTLLFILNIERLD